MCSTTLSAQVSADFTASTTAGCSPLIVNFQNLSTGSGTLTYSWDLGNGNTSNSENPSASYFDPGFYTITLTVSNGTDTDTEVKTSYIEVYTPPTPGISPSQTIGCYPFDVVFTDASVPGSSPIATWSWDFGDGGTSTQQNPTNTYGLAGNFSVTLLLTDQNGCASGQSFPDVIESNDNRPTAFFSASPTVSCNPPVDVNFADGSFGGTGALTYEWVFDDGNTDNVQNPINTYATSGLFSPMLTVTDQLGCSDSLTLVDHINIVDDVVVDFTASDTAVCLGESVTFTDISSPQPIFWQWQFGDGQTSGDQNPTHNYVNPGTYSVTLTAFYEGTCNDQVVYTDLITVSEIPVPGFTNTNPVPCETPHPVTFTNTSTGGSNLTYSWNFGAGGPNSTQENPTYNYQTAGVFDVSLTVENEGGCTANLTVNDLVDITATVADFLPDVFGFCQPLDVNFTDMSTSGSPIVSWEWDFGDGGTSNLQNPSYTYADTGIFDVTLIVVNDLGCTDTLVRSNYIFVATPPQADFVPGQTLFCAGTEVQFTDLSVGATDWFWDFGDNGTSSEQNPIHEFVDSGFYSVTLIALNNGCPDTIVYENLLYSRPPNPDLTRIMDCENPFTVSFEGDPAAASSWFWEFNDGSPTETDINVTHTFADPGQHIVQLIATNDTSGCTVARSDTFTITIPVADFTLDDTAGCKPLEINFTDLSEDAFTYSWDFGDGGSSSTANPTHTYQEIGTYTVTLIITDINGCNDTLIMPNAVTVTGAVVDFGITDIIGCDSLAVSFGDSTLPPGSVVSWDWDFGDGGTSTEQNPTHIYQVPGLYDVSLTITDTGTCQNTITYPDLVQYIPFPTADFSLSSAGGCMADTFYTTNLSSANAVSYLWNFGNGQTSTDFEPSFVYHQEGVFDVTLTVFTDLGCPSTLVMDDAVSILHPNAAFSAFPTFAFCPPLLVTINDLSQGDVVQWFWDFGDGSNSTLQFPSHIYNQSGVFDVSLIATNSLGCSDTLLNPELVQLAGPSGDFSFFPDTAGCPPYDITYVANADGATQYTWDFGDGVLGSGDSTTHTYTQIGTYIPSLILEDDNGCVFTYQSDDTLTVEPLVVSAGLDQIICENDSVPMLASGGSVFSWFPVQGLSDPNIANPIASPSVTTEYIVNVQLGQCQNSDTVVVTVNPAPIIEFSANRPCFGDSTQIVNLSSVALPDVIDQWNWTLGDGQTSTLENPLVLYSVADTFMVSLQVTTNSGCTATDSAEVIVNPSPVAAFSANDTCLFLPTFFNDQSFADNGTITEWWWDLGNGANSTIQNPSLTYFEDSVYSVTLAVVAAGGCVDTITQDVEVFPLPEAGFTAEAVCFGEETMFIDTSTVASGNIAQWDWDLGDLTTSSVQNPTHIYTDVATFAVSLVVTTNNGCTDEVTEAVTVNPLPISDFTMPSTQSCVSPVSLNLFNNSSGASSFLWNMSNGDSATTFNTVANFDTVDVYNIELVVTNQFGCQDSSEQSFTVYPTPVAQFSVSDQTGCAPLDVFFTDLSENIISLEWDLDGESSTDDDPFVTYEVDGDYSISLAVLGNGGCTDTLTLNNHITVWPNPTALFEYSPVTGPGSEGTIQFENLSLDHTSSWWAFGDEDTSNLEHPLHQYDFYGSKFVTLAVMDDNGCVDTLEQYVHVEFFGGLFVPNALIPNDPNPEVRVFLPKGTGLGYYRLMIFDEWGNLLFETTELENGSPAKGWDGSFRGEIQQQDAYIWKIDAIFENGDRWDGREFIPQSFNKTGTVTLIR